MSGAPPQTEWLLDNRMDLSHWKSPLGDDDMVLEKRHDADSLMMMRRDGQRAGWVHTKRWRVVHCGARTYPIDCCC